MHAHYVRATARVSSCLLFLTNLTLQSTEIFVLCYGRVRPPKSSVPAVLVRKRHGFPSLVRVQAGLSILYTSFTSVDVRLRLPVIGDSKPVLLL